MPPGAMSLNTGHFLFVSSVKNQTNSNGVYPNVISYMLGKVRYLFGGRGGGAGASEGRVINEILG